MRELSTHGKIHKFFEELGKVAKVPISFYVTGGTSAVLMGWRESTIDIDFMCEPENDLLFKSFPKIKEVLNINLEQAAPSQFIPELPDWQGRSQFICTCGKISFYHYDFYSQALSKIERGHQKDLLDVQNMVKSDLIQCKKLEALFLQIEDNIYKYVSLNKDSFKKAVMDFISKNK